MINQIYVINYIFLDPSKALRNKFSLVLFCDFVIKLEKLKIRIIAICIIETVFVFL